MSIDSKPDVHDTARLAAYLPKRREWLELLSDEKQHSVNGQLNGLLWQDATFYLFNKMRKGASDKRPPTITSGLLSESLDSGYATNMIVGIGRLIDAPADVVSLRRVFDDVRRHRELITREVFVCHDALPFDPKSVPSLFERARPGEIVGAVVGGPFDGATSELLHTTFDRLPGVTSDKLVRNDRIADVIFDEIEALLADPAIQDVVDRRHKFVAHAADVHSAIEETTGWLLNLDRRC